MIIILTVHDSCRNETRSAVTTAQAPRGGFLDTHRNRQREGLGRPQKQQSQRDPDAIDINAATAVKEIGMYGS